MVVAGILLSPVFGALMLAGLFLAFYLPAVPFVLWMFGIVGLMIMVLEMLFAAPVWAAAHAIPEGEGMAGQYARQGYMLYVAVLLRAPLMLCGFFSGVLAYSAMAWLIAKGLRVYVASTAGDYIMSPISVVSMVVLSTAMFVFLEHKCFGLISHLPEKVLAWIGSGTGSFNEAGEEQRISGVFMTGGRMGIETGGKGGVLSQLRGKKEEAVANKNAGTKGDDSLGFS